MNIQEIREKYPQYNHASDEQLADAIHKKYYLHVPKDEFYKKIGLDKQKPGLGSYLKEPLISLLELGTSLGRATKPSFIPDAEFNWRGAVGGVPEEQRTLGHKAAGFAPELLASLLAPEVAVPARLAEGAAAVKGGKYALKAAQQALPQAGVAAAFNPEDALSSAKAASETQVPFSLLTQALAEQNPILRNIGRAASSVAGAYMGNELAGTPGEIGGAILGAGLGRKGAVRNIARDIQQGAEGTGYKQLMKDAQELGLKYLTPAEATGTPFLGRIQGVVARTEEGGKKLYQEGKERIASEKKAWQDVLDTIYSPKESDALKKEFYDKAHVSKVPTKAIKEFVEDPIIAQAMDDISKNKAYQKKLKDVPTEDLKYWDYVKRAIYQREKGLPPGTEERAILAETRNGLVDKLDSLSEDYAKGRALAELSKTKKNLAKKLNDADIRGTNIQKVLRNDDKFNELMHSLRNMPQAQNKLKKMREVTRGLINPITPRTAVGYGTTGMYEGRNTATALAHEWMLKLSDTLRGGSQSEKLAELLTNPEWDKELSRILALTKGEKAAIKGVDVAGKALAQGLGNANNRALSDKK